MPLDPLQPADDMEIPAFPAYLRGVWANNILPATVPYNFSLYQLGPVAGGLNAGTEVVVSAATGMSIIVHHIVARVKTPGTTETRLNVLLNGNNMLTSDLVVPVGERTSIQAIPDLTALDNGDLLQMAVVAAGAGAADLSVHLLCTAKVLYP